MNDDSLSEPLTRHFLQADAMPLRIFAGFIFLPSFSSNRKKRQPVQMVQLAS
jgi:hypothetical protein